MVHVKNLSRLEGFRTSTEKLFVHSAKHLSKQIRQKLTGHVNSFVFEMIAVVFLNHTVSTHDEFFNQIDQKVRFGLQIVHVRKKFAHENVMRVRVVHEPRRDVLNRRFVVGNAGLFQTRKNILVFHGTKQRQDLFGGVPHQVKDDKDGDVVLGEWRL